MPVRSLTSPTLSWPDHETVHRAAKRFAKQLRETHPEVKAVAYFGSYARGDWGVGSDLDLLIIASTCAKPAERGYPTQALPVPCDTIVYTPEEWRDLRARPGRWTDALVSAVWLEGAELADEVNR